MHSPARSCLRGEEQFLHEVRNSLHALAQPLTLLQVRLEAALLCGADASPGEPLLSTLGGDVQRACEHFGAMQELIRSRDSMRLESARFCGQDLLRSVHEAFSPRFTRHAVKLRHAAPVEEVWVFANEHDVRCSLLQALFLFKGLLSASDLIELSLQTAGTFALVELVVSDWGGLEAEAPPFLAEAITRSIETLGFVIIQDSYLKATMRLPLSASSGAKASQ